MFGAMALVDLRAEILQPLGYRRRPQVGTRDRIAQRQEHLGDATHADAADADQMNTLEIVEAEPHGRAISSIMSAILRAASGRAILRARAPSSVRFRGSLNK